MTRSVAWTLSAVWDADLSLSGMAHENARVGDLALIEQRVSTALPAGALTPPDLRDAAMARLEHAAALLGSVTLDRFSTVARVWRPLLQALGRAVDLCWDDPGTVDTGWFPGRIAVLPLQAVPAASG